MNQPAARAPALVTHEGLRFAARRCPARFLEETRLPHFSNPFGADVTRRALAGIALAAADARPYASALGLELPISRERPSPVLDQ